MGVEKAEGVQESVEVENAPEVRGDNEYYIFDNKFYRVERSKTLDLVDGLYTINTKSPLPQFDSSACKAYSVTSKQAKSSDELYAVVLDKKYPVRLEEINKLLEDKCPNFSNIVAAQIIHSSLGKGSFFAVILEKPKGITLNEYMQKNGAIKENVIADEVVAKISAVVSFFSKKKIVHGRINLDTVYIDDNGNITVSECISDLCGASQQILYESLNRSASMPMGKGGGIVGSTDYYALGVIAAIMLRGKSPVEGRSDKEILNMKYTENTYKIVAGDMEFSPQTMDFLRGVINDKSIDVWGGSHVEEWVKGRKFNLLPPADSDEAGRPIIFNGKKYLNPKYLAHSLYLNWAEAKAFIREDTLIRWIERSLLDKELAEKMEVLSNRTGGDSTANFDKDDELLTQYIMLMDPYGPIRMKGFSAMLDGLGGMIAFGAANEKKQLIESVINIILFSLSSYMSIDKFDKINSNMRDYSLVLQRCLDLLRKKDLGFGVERCLYELNPTLPCQSNILLDHMVFATGDLLKTMDSEDSIGSNIVDKHIAAFLSSRLELNAKIRITSLARFADFAINLHVQMLSLLSLAQEITGIKSLNKLSVKVVDALENVVDSFHSKYVRKDISGDLKKMSGKGRLPDILKIITDTQYLVRDRLGFRKAVTRYRNNKIQILKLSNRKAINNMGYRYGLHLSVLLSFFVATVVVIVLMLKAF